MCKFTTTHLMHCLDTFATQIAEFQELRFSERSQSLESVIHHTTQLLFISEQQNKYLEYLRNIDGKVTVKKKSSHFFRYSENVWISKLQTVD
jgi:hypothetical protein